MQIKLSSCVQNAAEKRLGGGEKSSSLSCLLASLQSKSWSNAYANKQHLAAMHLKVKMVNQELSLFLFWHNNSIWKRVFYPCQSLSKNFYSFNIGYVNSDMVH